MLVINIIKNVIAEDSEKMLTTVVNNLTTELCENETLELCTTTVNNNESTEIIATGNNTTELNFVNTTAVSPATTKSPEFHTHYIPEKDCYCDMTVSSNINSNEFN